MNVKKKKYVNKKCQINLAFSIIFFYSYIKWLHCLGKMFSLTLTP